MITLQEYFGPWLDHPDATPERKAAAGFLLEKVNMLLEDADLNGVVLEDNPVTSNAMHSRDEVSGQQYGGFRPQSCPIGAPHSAHKEGRAVDVFDPHGTLDAWITDEILSAYRLYREAPAATKGWAHLTDRAPASGKRTFAP